MKNTPGITALYLKQVLHTRNEENPLYYLFLTNQNSSSNFLYAPQKFQGRKMDTKNPSTPPWKKNLLNNYTSEIIGVSK